MAVSSLEALAAELSKLKALGHTAVALDTLLSYVNDLTQSARAADPEAERQRIGLDFGGRVEQYKAEVEGRRELFKAVIEAGQSALGQGQDWRRGSCGCHTVMDAHWSPL